MYRWSEPTLQIECYSLFTLLVPIRKSIAIVSVHGKRQYKNGSILEASGAIVV